MKKLKATLLNSEEQLESLALLRRDLLSLTTDDLYQTDLIAPFLLALNHVFQEYVSELQATISCLLDHICLIEAENEGCYLSNRHKKLIEKLLSKYHSLVNSMYGYLTATIISDYDKAKRLNYLITHNTLYSLANALVAPMYSQAQIINSLQIDTQMLCQHSEQLISLLDDKAMDLISSHVYKTELSALANEQPAYTPDIKQALTDYSAVNHAFKNPTAILTLLACITRDIIVRRKNLQPDDMTDTLRLSLELSSKKNGMTHFNYYQFTLSQLDSLYLTVSKLLNNYEHLISTYEYSISRETLTIQQTMPPTLQRFYNKLSELNQRTTEFITQTYLPAMRVVTNIGAKYDDSQSEPVGETLSQEHQEGILYRIQAYFQNRQRELSTFLPDIINLDPVSLLSIDDDQGFFVQLNKLLMSLYLMTHHDDQGLHSSNYFNAIPAARNTIIFDANRFKPIANTNDASSQLPTIIEDRRLSLIEELLEIAADSSTSVPAGLTPIPFEEYNRTKAKIESRHKWLRDSLLSLDLPYDSLDCTETEEEPLLDMDSTPLSNIARACCASPLAQELLNSGVPGQIEHDICGNPMPSSSGQASSSTSSSSSSSRVRKRGYSFAFFNEIPLPEDKDEDELNGVVLPVKRFKPLGR